MVSGSLISALVLIPLIALVGQGLTAPLFPESTKPPSASCVPADLGALRALHRRGRGGGGRHRDRDPRAADDVPLAAAPSLAGLRRGDDPAADGGGRCAHRPRHPRLGRAGRARAGGADAVRGAGPAGRATWAPGPRLVASLGVAIFGARVRGRVVPHRRAHRRVVATRHRAWRWSRCSACPSSSWRSGWTDLVRARRDPHRRHRGLRGRVEGGRHLAGPEDRTAGRGHAGAPAARAVHRRRVRVLGGGGARCCCSATPTPSGRRTCRRPRPR